MRKYIIGITCSIILTPVFTNGQTVNMSLDDCLKYAEKNQVKIKNSLLDQQSVLAKNKEITGMAYPQLKAKGGVSYAPLVAAFEVPNFIKSAIAGDEASGQSGLVKDEAINDDVRNNTPNTIPLAFQPKWSTTGSLEASQILFDPTVMVALQARKAYEELASKSVELSVQDVKVGVTKAYYNVLIAEKQMELVIQNISRMQQMEFETKEIYKQGFAEKIDVDRITVTLNNLQTQKIRIDQRISLAYMALKFQMGMSLSQQIALTDKLSEQARISQLLVEQLDFNSRNEYQLLQIQKDFYSYDVKRYRLGWMPSLSLFANSGYTLYNDVRLFDPKDSWQRSALVGTSLNIPIFDGLQRRQKMKQAELTVQKTENDIDNLKSAMMLEEQSAKVGLKNNLLALENQKMNMELAENVYNTSSIKYKEGVGSSLEIMNAESSLKEAQTNYFLALYEVMTSYVDLQKALGLLK